MKTLSIINLKGGVGKTISSVNIAHILAAVHKKRVLLIDNDKQGNASKFYNRHDYEHKGIAEVMTEVGRLDIREAIQHTETPDLDIITANMNLLTANLQVILDQTRPQQTRMRTALEPLINDYDYCIIDNAPDINISTINALVASDEVAIPITIDDFAMDGLKELREQIKNTQEELNPGLIFLGCFITQYDCTNDADQQGEEYLRDADAMDDPIFKTHIRKSPKIKPSTFARMPIIKYSPRSVAAVDYKRFVKEYLEMH